MPAYRARLAEVEAVEVAVIANGALLSTLKQTLLDSGCDGDLCAHSWHEEARQLIARIEDCE